MSYFGLCGVNMDKVSYMEIILDLNRYGFEFWFLYLIVMWIGLYI